VLGASLATKNGTADPGHLIVESYGTFAIPVILLVIHGPIATNIINMYTFSVATQALDIQVSRKKLSILVGCLAMAAVIGFMFATDFAHLLHNWIIAIAAWVATWGGIMAVHYFVFERRHKNFSYLFRSVDDTQLKAFNPSAFIAFFAGIFMTWMCMYGSVPILQGPLARAVGGVDFSWLGGTVTAAAVYFILGYPRFRSRIAAGIPLGLKESSSDEEFLKTYGSCETALADDSESVHPDAPPAPENRTVAPTP
jgi:NCS1 family nucleobase:cation symporter-1